MFKNTRPTVGGVGLRLMQKMGWRVGEGLGPDGMGNVEPLVLDVKNDRKGLIAQDDPGVKGSAPKGGDSAASKHPVSMLMELCAKRKWPSPTFISHESGPPNIREFRCT
ncbi:g-patch domain protein, partial [Oesophagostomum dentatum]